MRIRALWGQGRTRDAASLQGRPITIGTRKSAVCEGCATLLIRDRPPGSTVTRATVEPPSTRQAQQQKRRRASRGKEKAKKAGKPSLEELEHERREAERARVKGLRSAARRKKLP